jgi:hypothetical protein
MNEDHFQFPRGLFQTLVLTNVAQDVGTAGVPQRVKWIDITGGAAAEVIIFRSSDGATEYFRLNVGIAGTLHLDGFSFYAKSGLEILTADAAGDVKVTIAYVDPTVGPGTLTGRWS